MGNIFVRIHVAVYVGLVFHDVGFFVRKKAFDRNVDFLQVIRQFVDIGRNDVDISRESNRNTMSLEYKFEGNVDSPFTDSDFCSLL